MSKWISVDKQQPKKDELVLTITNGKPTNNITLIDAYELGEYTDGGWIIAEWPEWRDAKVTHWMPLPEPPGECPCEARRGMDEVNCASTNCDDCCPTGGQGKEPKKND